MSNVLDLSTIVERSTITIDGESYELRHASEFGLAESQALGARWLPIKKVLATNNATESQIEQAEAAARKVISDIVVDLPEAVLGKLKFWHCGQIAGAWFRTNRDEADEDFQTED